MGYRIFCGGKRGMIPRHAGTNGRRVAENIGASTGQNFPPTEARPLRWSLEVATPYGCCLNLTWKLAIIKQERERKQHLLDLYTAMELSL